MTTIALICPSCGRRLTVTERAPMVLTCPNCLARMARPTEPLPLAPLHQTPLPVIPLEYEAQRDSTASGVAVGIIIVLIAAGIAYFLFNRPHGFEGYLLLGVGILTMLALAFVAVEIKIARGDRRRMWKGIGIVTGTYFSLLVGLPLLAVGVGLLILLGMCFGVWR